MRSNAARKWDYDTYDNEVMELDREDIAQRVEAACNLKGNKGSCDFEMFMQKYNIRPTFNE